MIENFDQNEIIFILTVMTTSAVIVGFMAGLFGIGGGLIMVPVLFYVFSLVGIERTFVMHLAVGTSFSIIIPNSIISTITHMKFKAVDFSIVKTFGTFVAIGVVLGTIFAVSLKTSSLILFFSIMTMLFAIYFLMEKEKINPIPRDINLIYRVICGFLSGFLSAPMGIGGGVFNTPIFKMFGYPINIAIGSSAAIGFLIALIGAVGFAVSGTYFNIVKTFGAFVVIGVVLGTIFAVSLKTSSLVLFFSIITMFFAIYFLTAKEKINPIQREINLIYRVIFGFLSGFLSAPMGIAGGVINTPILKIFGYQVKVAIGSSAAVGFLIALIGAIGFAVSGSYLNVNVPLSLGFVNIPAFLIFAPITMFMAKIGAKTVHKFDKKLIGKLFGVYLFIISCKLFYEYFSF